MPAILHLFSLPTLTLLVGCAAEVQTSSDSVLVFSDVNVIPMGTERVLEANTVVVRDGVITALGASDSVEIPQNARIVDGRGCYLMPGLTDFHIHLRSTDELLSYLAYGVTTVVHVSGAMSGAPNLLGYREQLEGGEMLGPRLFTTGPILDGDPPIFGSVSTVVTTPEEGRRVVEDQKQAGYDFIKVYNNLQPEVFSAVADEAREQGMAVLGHIPRIAGRVQALQRALEAGLDLIAHGEEYFFTYFYGDVESSLDRGEVPHPDEELIPDAVRMTKDAGAAVIPNLSFVAMTRRMLDSLEVVLADPETNYLHPDVLEMWREQNPTRRRDLERFDMREEGKYAFLKRLTKALHDVGIPLILGSDASAPGLFPGKSAHLELSELVDAGLSPYEALATGTRVPAEFIGKHVASSGQFGTVAVGQHADLILLTENPLNDIQNITKISGVMVRGRWLPSAELQHLRINRTGD